METTAKDVDYKLKERFFSPVFLSFLPVLYYVDYVDKLIDYIGFPYPPIEYSSKKYILRYIESNPFTDIPALLKILLYPFIYLIFAAILFHYGPSIERAINEPFRKFQVIIFPVLLTMIIMGNVFVFRGNANWMIVEKLSWCWGIAVVLIIYKMFFKAPITKIV